MFTSGAGPGDREPGHPGQQLSSRVRSTTEFEPRYGRLGGAAEGCHRARPSTGVWMRSPRWWRSSPARESSYITGANLTVDGGMNA